MVQIFKLKSGKTIEFDTRKTDISEFTIEERNEMLEILKRNIERLGVADILAEATSKTRTRTSYFDEFIGNANVEKMQTKENVE